MILAEFNPMILFLLLWGLLSWLTKKKKEQLKEKDQGEYSETQPKEDIFARLQKLQDHLSAEVDIFSSAPEAVETERNILLKIMNMVLKSLKFLKQSQRMYMETQEMCLKQISKYLLKGLLTG